MTKRALITGITGQDGSYLAELLLEKGYEVHGMVRRSSGEANQRLSHIRDDIFLHTGDLLDQRSMTDVIREAQPDEIYNLAAMSYVAASWNQPVLTAEFTGTGVDRGLARLRLKLGEVDPDLVARSQRPVTVLMREIAARSISLIEVETAQPSPFARSLLFGYIAEFMYEGDAPLAERRAQALTLDSALLSELLGRTELRDLLDADVIVRTEAELQRTADDRRARTPEAVADLIRELGPLAADEIAARSTDEVDVAATLSGLADQRRVIEVRIAGTPR